MSEEIVVDELELLKQRADQLGIKYHPSIGLDTLRDKVNAALKTETSETNPEPEVAPELTAAQIEAKRIRELKAKANELVRIRVTCMNPAKKDWPGEIFTAGNSVVGTFRKMVPFEAEWHVPRIILNMMQERKYQSFYKVKTPKGEVTRNKLVKEFAIEILPPLTPKELKELAQRQAMANGTAEV